MLLGGAEIISGSIKSWEIEHLGGCDEIGGTIERHRDDVHDTIGKETSRIIWCAQRGRHDSGIRATISWQQQNFGYGE